MSRLFASLVIVVLTASLLAGCISTGGFGPNRAPGAVVTVTQLDEYTYVFDARDSSGRDLAFKWDFGDGTTSDQPLVEHIFRYGDSVYKVRLVVEDSSGTLDVWEQDVKVGTGINKPPIGLFGVDRRNYLLNQPVRVDASASWDPEGDPVRFRWDFNHLTDFDDYEEFRAAKTALLQGLDDEGSGPGGGGGQAGGDSPQGAPALLEDLVRDLEATRVSGGKHPGHGGGDGGDGCRTSLFSHVVETEEPVYTLEQGFEDATCFFIRLQVWDIKGGHEEIISEEIWPVQVWTEGTFPESVASGSREGRFDFGVPEELQDLLPDLEQYEYEAEFTFVVPWPIVDTLQGVQGAPDGLLPGGYLNITWEAESDDLPAGVLDSGLQVNVTTPNGRTLGGSSTDGLLRLELNGQEDYTGENWETPWQVHIIARSGWGIDWRFDWWIQMDTNPFKQHE